MRTKALQEGAARRRSDNLMRTKALEEGAAQRRSKTAQQEGAASIDTLMPDTSPDVSTDSNAANLDDISPDDD